MAGPFPKTIHGTEKSDLFNVQDNVWLLLSGTCLGHSWIYKQEALPVCFTGGVPALSHSR